jgi:hypothetical protein
VIEQERERDCEIERNTTAVSPNSQDSTQPDHSEVTMTCDCIGHFPLLINGVLGMDKAIAITGANRVRNLAQCVSLSGLATTGEDSVGKGA